VDLNSYEWFVDMRAIARRIKMRQTCRACYNRRMLKGFWERIEKRRAQALLESVQTWYATSLSVSEICGEALHDLALIQADIGTVLDKADRKLFQYRNDASDARLEVRRHNPQLASQIGEVTQQVYELRNLTAKFLIRAQGPSPFAGSRTEGELQAAYYERALNEAGFQARNMKIQLDQTIRTMWPELEKLVRQAEKALL